jgi:hypothetical protein
VVVVVVVVAVDITAAEGFETGSSRKTKRLCCRGLVLWAWCSDQEKRTVVLVLCPPLAEITNLSLSGSRYFTMLPAQVTRRFWLLVECEQFVESASRIRNHAS